MKVDNKQRLKPVRKRKSFELFMGSLAALLTLFFAAGAEAQTCRQQTFADVLQVNHPSGNIIFSFNSYITENPDNTLTSPQIQRDPSSNKNTCPTANCTATGTTTPAQQLEPFQFTSTTLDYTVPHMATGYLGDSGQRTYRLVNAEGNTILNIREEEHSPSNHYKIDTLNLGFQAQLNLRPGTYWIKQLSMETEASINVVGAGTAKLYIYNSFNPGWMARLNVNQLGQPLDSNQLIVVAYTGAQLNTGLYSGYFYSPSIVQLGDRYSLFGAINAGSIKLQNEAKVAFRAPANNSDLGQLCTGDTSSDSDNDGVHDDLDQCNATPPNEIPDIHGCAPSQKDSDLDLVNDKLDQCPNTPPGTFVDQYGCSPGEMKNCREQLFADGMQVHTSQGKIQFGHNAYIADNPDRILNATQVLSDSGSTLLSCQSGHCLAAGNPVPQHQLQAYEYSPDTAGYNIPYYGSGNLAINGRRNYGTVNVDTGATLNIDSNGHNPDQPYHLKSLSLQYMSVWNARPGTYWIENFSVGTKAKINVIGDGIVRIYSKNTVSLNGEIRINYNTSGPQKPNQFILVSYDGIFTGDGLVSGYFFARTNVSLGYQFQLHGSLVAGDIVTNSASKITYQAPQERTDLGQICPADIVDSDGDNVLDRYDVCPDTDDGATVNTNGCAPNQLDSDNDGLNDQVELEDGTDPSDPDSDNDGVNDFEEKQDGTNPLNPDSDGDGISDSQEKIDNTNPLSADTDSDGVNDGVEKADGTNPINPDTDGDGVAEGVEKADGTNPLNADSDNDGVDDGTEKADGTNPLATDSDSDGIADGIEKSDGTNPVSADSDGDGVNDGTEKADGTNPLSADSDSDGVSDGTEKGDGTNPLNTDSDGDGLSDGTEKAEGTDPLRVDSDSDGIEDGAEKADGTDPLNADSDGDGVNDGTEKTDGTDPLNADSDSDGVNDGIEKADGTNPLSADSDADGVNDGTEKADGTDPLQADSDSDGVSDSVEKTDGTDPLNPDSDTDGVHDGAEKADGTDPLNADSDADGVTDGVEKADGTNPLNPDSDSDGVNDGTEKVDGTNPLNADSDSDGVSDGIEKNDGTSPLNADSDNDGVDDGTEKADGTNPLATDSDSDGIADGIEKSDGTNPLSADSDGDGVNDAAEKADGTNPLSADSDADGVNDGTEKADGTDPLQADSDSDGVSDSVEKTDGTDPLNPDSDTDGVNDGAEKADGTDPLNADSDADGVTDGLEKSDGTNPLNPDSDSDGVNDGTEKADGTNPLNADSDSDGVSDGIEKTDGTSPLNADSDSDGVNDGIEKTDGTNPLNADSDSDGVDDGTEKADGTNPLSADSDADGVNDGTEKADGTSPLNADSDSDGVNDGVEKTDGTNPLNADSDSDGVNDGIEKTDGTNPLNADSDADGVNDGTEKADGTNPLNPDSDADGINDGTEKADGTNPLNADSDSDGVSDSEEKAGGTNPLNEDSDLDGIQDGADRFPLDPTESLDLDNDGIGDNSDDDRDGDGFSNEVEDQRGTNPSDPNDYPELNAPQLGLGIPDSQVVVEDLITVSGTIEDESAVTVVVRNSLLPLTNFTADISGNNWTAQIPLEVGTNLLTVRAEDRYFNVAEKTAIVEREIPSGTYGLTVHSPTNGSQTTNATVVVRGGVSSEYPALNITVTVAGVPTTIRPTGDVTEFTYVSQEITLTEGLNVLPIQATFEYSGQTEQTQRSLYITYAPEQEATPQPRLTILSPTNGAFINETSFYLVGEAQSFSGAAILSINGDPVALENGQTQAGTFKELISFPGSADNLTVNIYLRDDLGQSTSAALQFFRDGQAPVITLDKPLQLLPAENLVLERPYTLSGKVADANLASFQINGQAIALDPTANANEYAFRTQINPIGGQASQVNLQAVDLSGNTTAQGYIIRLDSEVALTMVLPPPSTTLINSGNPIPVQVVAKVAGSASDTSVRAIVLDSSGTQIAQSGLTLDGSYLLGEITLPANAGQYTIEVQVIADAVLLTKATRAITVEDAQDVELSLQSLTPANGAVDIEPNQPITLSFSKTIDPSLLQININETAHGNTYIRKEGESQDAVVNEGYQLQRVDREYAPVPGGLGALPGNRLFTFYPSQWLAYSADVYVEVIYDGQEMIRSHFKTRALPTFVDGGVLDQFGQPVAGVTVTLPELKRSAVTNSAGAFTFGYGDAASQQLPAGRHTLVINPDMAVAGFGTLSQTVTINSGVRNTLGVLRLPALNQQDAFTPVSGGTQVILGKGDLQLDFSNAKLLFDNGRSTGLMQAQFNELQQLSQRTDPDFIGLWYFGLQPQGVKVEGDFTFKLRIPAYQDNVDYLGPDGTFQLILATDPDSDTIVPLGVGQRQGDHIISLRHQITTLTYLGVVPVPDHYQAVIEQYRNGELSLSALVVRLRSDLLRIRSGEYQIPGL